MSKKMVRGRAGVSTQLIVAIAAVVVVVILAVVFWPSGEPVKLVVGIQGQPTAGKDMVVQVTISTSKSREMTIVAELFNSRRELITIVREPITVDDEDTVPIRLKLPTGLPAGVYSLVVTAQYDSSKLVFSKSTVDIAAMSAVVEPPVVVHPVIKPELPEPEEPLPPVIVPEIPEEPTFPTPPQEIPDEYNETFAEPPTVFVQPKTIDEIALNAGDNKEAAISECLALRAPDDVSCMGQVAVNTGDGEVCERLDGFSRDKCFLSLASAGTFSACDKIEEDSLRATCNSIAALRQVSS